MSVQEIEAAIRQLPPNELTQLMAWMADHHQDVWDRQIENDLESGRLDQLLDEAEQEYQAGMVVPR